MGHIATSGGFNSKSNQAMLANPVAQRIAGHSENARSLADVGATFF
jgi:hypothetical protein